MYRLLVIGKFLCQSLITLFKLDKLLKNNYAKIMDRIIRENPLRISIVNGVHLLQPQVKFVNTPISDGRIQFVTSIEN